MPFTFHFSKDGKVLCDEDLVADRTWLATLHEEEVTCPTCLEMIEQLPPSEGEDDG